MTSKTQDTILNRIDRSMIMIRRELEKKYGGRYVKYREQYKATDNFVYKPKFPLYIMLEQTYSCNLKCPSCIQGISSMKNRYKPKNLIMEWQLFERIIKEAEQNSCPSLGLMVNDEPLLVKDLPKRVVYAKEHGFMEIFMTTNGNLMNYDLMVELINAGVTHILFSIDAATEATYEKVRPGGNFKKVYDNVKNLYEYKRANNLVLPAVRASFVPSRYNIHEKEIFINTFLPYVDFIDIQGYSVINNININDVPPGYKKVEIFKCNEPWRKLIVRQNGDVLPCCSFYGYDLVLGNCFSQSLKEIFQGEMMEELRNSAKTGIYKNKTCITCTSNWYTCK